MGINVSFGSTFKVNNEANNYEQFRKFKDFTFLKVIKDEVGLEFKDSFKSPSKYYAEYTVIAPDSMDNEFETYCANKGIKYTKLTNDRLLDPSNISYRIREPKKGMRLAYINPDKLEELVQNQETNIPHCKQDYECYYSKKVDNNIKSGDEISATTLWIHGQDSTEKTLDYIKKYGADHLNPKQLFVDFSPFSEKTGSYFALKDMGWKAIPMYVDNNTYNIANALGILSKEN